MVTAMELVNGRTNGHANGHPNGHAEQGAPPQQQKALEEGTLARGGGLPHSASSADLDSARGMRITFQALTFTVQDKTNKKQKKTILSNVSGFFSPGQMSCILGPSGCGKTTLLDLLSGRKTTGELQGSIKFAGQAPTPTFLRRYSSYVEQFDTLLAMLTVEEMLLYTAELKRERKESLADKKARVEEVIRALALDSCRKVTIGSALHKGISGGEAKRTNVGIALVTNPRVLFLDEPTSGLDTYTAGEVMDTVKGLVREGITICATVHSPTPHIFDLFDRLLMMQRGRVVYYGDNGPGVVDYFQALPEVRRLGPKDNTAEWLIDITTKADRQGQASRFADAYDKSDLQQRNAEELQHCVESEKVSVSSKTLEQLQVRRATVTPSWWAFLILFKYRARNNYRDGAFLGPRIGDKLIYMFLIFTAFWHLGNNLSPQNVPNVAGVLYLWITLPAFGAAAYTPAIVMERPVFVRERSDGLYRVITYLSYKMVEELILASLVSLVASLVVYKAVQLGGTYLIVWLVFNVTLANGIVLAYFIAALSPNMDVANAALPAYVVTLLFFAGFLLRWSEIPPYWIWYGVIDFLRYAWGALMINEFQGKNVEVFGTEVLQYYSLQNNSAWAFLGYESLFFILFFFLAWCALSFKNHSKR